jgi:hypothetical protein
MTDIHNDYLKDEHLEDEEEDELNLRSQKSNLSLRQTTIGTHRLLTKSYRSASWSR